MTKYTVGWTCEFCGLYSLWGGPEYLNGKCICNACLAEKERSGEVPRVVKTASSRPGDSLPYPDMLDNGTSRAYTSGGPKDASYGSKTPSGTRTRRW